MASYGCDCGTIEPSFENERRGHCYKRQVADARRTIEQMEANIARWEEQAARLFGGGLPCEDCEEMGGWQTPDGPRMGESGWEECSTCEGYGITRALTCDDHEKEG